MEMNGSICIITNNNYCVYRESNLKDRDMTLKVFELNGIEVVQKEIDIDE